MPRKTRTIAIANNSEYTSTVVLLVYNIGMVLPYRNLSFFLGIKSRLKTCARNPSRLSVRRFASLDFI